MEMAWLMLQQKKPDDYVVATGETHSVKEFLEKVQEISGQKIKLVVDENYIRPQDVEYLCGDSDKAQKILGWKPKTKFKDLVKIMVKAKLKDVSKK